MHKSSRGARSYRVGTSPGMGLGHPASRRSDTRRQFLQRLLRFGQGSLRCLPGRQDLGHAAEDDLPHLGDVRLQPLDHGRDGRALGARKPLAQWSSFMYASRATPW